MLAVKNDYMFSYGKKNHYTSFLDSWTSDFFFFFARIYTAITGFNGPKNHHYYIVLM